MTAKRKPQRRHARSTRKRSVVDAVCLGYLAILVVVAIAGSAITPHPPNTVDLPNRFRPPFWQGGGDLSYMLGADSLGRDVLSRVMVGARISLIIGVSVTLLAGLIGTALGLLAGFRGGRWDNTIMRIADAQSAFPGLLLLIAVIGALGPSVVAVIVVLVIYGWMLYARMVRASVLQIRQSLFVTAAEMSGSRGGRIVHRHIVPMITGPLLAVSMLELARVMMAEAGLSYLGFGIQPPDTSWGLQVADNQQYLTEAWWTVVAPGLALAATVLAMNIVASSLRLRFDPRLHREQASIEARKHAERDNTSGSWVQPATEESTIQMKPVVNTPTQPPLLRVDSLRVRFHTANSQISAVQGVAFDVAPGETLGLVGESGSGKSATALALLDLLGPTAQVGGQCWWEGQLLTPKRARRLRGTDVTMIFQDPMIGLNPLKPVGEQVAELLRRHKSMSRDAARRRAIELFDHVGINNSKRRVSQFPHEFSGGMAQRVMIAMALAPEPKLIIADEPTTALDVTIQAQILRLIAQLQEETGVALVLISHDLAVVASVCDRVAVMYQGRIVEIGDAERIFSDPRHPYTKGLIESTPNLVSVRSELSQIPGNPPAIPLDVPGCSFAERCVHSSPECGTRPNLGPLTGIDADLGGRMVACWHPVRVKVDDRVGAGSQS